MKKALSIILILTLAVSFFSKEVLIAETATQFRGMSDPDLLPYIQDTLYESLVQELKSESYFVENVNAVYISQDYLDELAFNSLANIYFGYTLADLDKQFQGQRYIFTLGANHETNEELWTDYDDTFDRIIQNVAIGSGVILICVTVSFVTAGMVAPACCMIFAYAADGAIARAITGSVFGGISAGIVKGIETGDMNEALKSAALVGSEGFKWGAITGAIAGGASEAIALKGATLNGLTMNEAAFIQCETGYPLSVIKEFHSLEEFQVYQDAGLMTEIIDGKAALIRNIDLEKTDAIGRTNLERMRLGEPALDPDGIAYEIHHVGQKNDSVFAILTQSEHRGQGNFRILHDNLLESAVDHGAAFEKQKRTFWIGYADLIGN